MLTSLLSNSSQAILLNTKGSPWAVRWFFVKPKSLYTSARASDESLNREQKFYSGELVTRVSNQSDDTTKKEKESLLPKPLSSVISGSSRNAMLETVTVSLLMLAMGVVLGRNSGKK